LRLDHLEYLALLILVGLSLILIVRLFRIRKKTIASIGTPSLLKALVGGVSPTKQRVKAALLLSGLLFLTLAIAGPQWGLRRDLLTMAGRDIIVAVDISESMYAKDVEPDRLSRAKIEISSLLDSFAPKAQGDRVGLLAFKGESLPIIPLTSDYDSLKEFIGGLETDLIPQLGTNIGGAIEASMRLLPAEGSSRAIILLTDGEDTYEGARAAAEAAKAQGIRIFPIGIGSEKGEPIPVEGGGYKRDRSGKIVLSKMDEQLLKEIAEKTDGIFVKSGPGEIGVERAYKEIRKMEKREWERRIQTQLQERYQYFLFTAFLLLFGEFIISERKGERK